ncbi:MAG: HAD family hydrolase [Candidatus Omnitrophica bacterium]|nr:HAD family hydrolase [Candidatus Omnitrophota bacterium]
MKRAVFLDRDGVLNQAVVRDGKPYAPASLEELAIVPDAAEAITTLRQAGFLAIVVTNQPDVGRGLQRRETVEAMHQRLRAQLPIDDIRVCYHREEDACACRKPKPGMLRDAARDWDVDLSRSIMVGDRWRDIEAGKAAGCRTILVRSPWAEQQAQAPDAVVASLHEASRLILSAWISRRPYGAAHAQA